MRTQQDHSDCLRHNADGHASEERRGILAAQDKLRTFNPAFGEWSEDTDRAPALPAVYNAIFNSVVPRTYDGST